MRLLARLGPAFGVSLLALALLLGPASVQAQDEGGPPTPPPKPQRAGQERTGPPSQRPARPAPPDSTQQERFRLADAYLRAGQSERAIALLEDLHDEAPMQPAFFEKLVEAYESVKRYDEALAALGRQLGRQATPALMAEKARLLYQQGREAEAEAAWRDAIALAPDDPQTYRVIVRSLQRQRRFERAVAVMEEARTRLGNTSLFLPNLAYLYSLTGEHAQAAREYLRLLRQSDEQLRFVQRRLSTFVEQDDARDATVAVLREAVRTDPLVRPYRELLGWLYLEGARYREAFDAYRAIDRLEEENGAVLYGFAQRAADAEAYEVALDAFELILARYPEAPAAPAARYAVGTLHRRWAEEAGERVFDGDGNRLPAPHYEAAADAFRAFLRAHPNHERTPDVLRDLGHLQQDVFLALGEAEATLQRVVERYPDAEAAYQARYDLGRLAVMRGDLGTARLAFNRLVERLRTGDLAQRARYELALLHFYEGDFEAALTRAEATNMNTSTDVANDAIELKVLLRANAGPDSLDTPLRRYATARLQARQRRHDDALATLDALLATYGTHALADEARFLRATLLRAQGRWHAAVSAFGELPLVHPQSAFADRSLMAAADLYATRLDDLEAAVTAYNRLLEDYPASLLAADARARLRTLWSERDTPEG